MALLKRGLEAQATIDEQDIARSAELVFEDGGME